MSPHVLALPVRPPLDRTRIAALSAAIALNLAALLVLMRPLAPQAQALLHHLASVPQVVFIDPPTPVPPPPPIDLKPLPHPPVAPPVLRQPLPQTPPSVPTSEPDTMATPPPVTPPASSPTDTTAAPAEVSLAYRSAPLRYPPQALRQHLQGTVLLRVLVDETGKPVAVEVMQGSGYAVLDRSAREQVLAHWRFQPAMVDGHAVRAWARVPVSFNLRDF